MENKYEVLHLAEMFEDDPEICEKYNRTGHKLLEYMDLSEDKGQYYVDDDKHCRVDFENLKPIVQCMEKTFENIQPNFKRVDRADAMSDDTVYTFLMNTYRRSEGGNEINDEFRYNDEIFDTIANITRSFALIGAYTAINGNQIYMPYRIMARLHTCCKSAYRKYRSYMGDLREDNIDGRQLKIISFLINILRYLYNALKSFDAYGENAEKDISKCPLVIVIMPKILMSASYLTILQNKIEDQRDIKLKRESELSKAWEALK